MNCSRFLCLRIISLWFVSLLSAAPLAQSDDATREQVKPPEPLRAAIFVKDRVGGDFAAQLGAFEDLLVSGLADMGFRVISPEDNLKAVRTFADQEDTTELDELLESDSSATQLAQTMGADYLLIASLATYGSSKQQFVREDLGINMLVVDHQLTSTYKIVDAHFGDAISSGSVTATERVEQSPSLLIEADTTNALLARAAEQIVSAIDLKGGSGVLVDISGKSDAVATFRVIPSVQDMMVPEVVIDEDGELTLTANRYSLEVLSVSVELNGVMIGTTPGDLSASPGIHKIKLSRVGFEDWERTINIKDGQSYGVALTLSEEGRAKWFEMADFLADLKHKERLSRAEQEAIRGFAEMMRNSGIKINIQSQDSFWK